MKQDWKDSDWCLNKAVGRVRVVGPFTFVATLVPYMGGSYAARVYWQREDGLYCTNLRTNQGNYTSLGSVKIGVAYFLRTYPRCTEIRHWSIMETGG